jgi:hypothetical protein
MPENGAGQKALGFTYEEIVTALLRARGITTGRWALFVTVGGQMATMPPGPGQPVVPALIAPLLQMGLHRIEGPGEYPGLVDAAALIVV